MSSRAKSRDLIGFEISPLHFVSVEMTSTKTMKKPNKIVIFDIDHTIFNSTMYRSSLFANLAKGLGYDIKKFSEKAHGAYKNMRKSHYFFTPDLLLKTILSPWKKPEDLVKAQSIFWEKLLYESCIYPEVKDVFTYLSENKIQIGIFSTGDLAHQKIKIESLKDYLDENHVHISPNKLTVIKDTFRTYKKYQTFLVDDYPQILETAKKHHKNIFTVFIRREESNLLLTIPDNFKPDATITDLHQLIDIIKANN